MFSIKDDFSAGAPISQVPTSWFNKVAKFLNNLIGISPIKVRKNANGISSISFEPSNKGAREDILPSPSSASSKVPAGLKLNEKSWERIVDAEDSETGERIFGAGVRMMVITRIHRHGDYDFFFWAWAYYDSLGMLYKISAEQGCFSELTQEGWLNS